MEQLQTTQPFFFQQMKSRKLLLFFTFLSFLFTISGCFRETQVKPQRFYHTLQPQESLQDISKKYSVDLLQLQRANGIYDPQDVATGTRILIPGKMASLSKPSPEPLIPAPKPRLQNKPLFIWPSPGTISSGYGKRHGRNHQGIDITKDRGRAIRAAGSGIIEFSGVQNGFGKTVIINHGSGFKTLYAHNAKINVSKGMRVKRGKVISKMGTTGRSTGIHLHFEIRVNGKPANPLRYLPIR